MNIRLSPKNQYLSKKTSKNSGHKIAPPDRWSSPRRHKCRRQNIGEPTDLPRFTNRNKHRQSADRFHDWGRPMPFICLPTDIQGCRAERSLLSKAKCTEPTAAWRWKGTGEKPPRRERAKAKIQNHVRHPRRTKVSPA